MKRGLDLPPYLCLAAAMLLQPFTVTITYFVPESFSKVDIHGLYGPLLVGKIVRAGPVIGGICYGSGVQFQCIAHAKRTVRGSHRWQWYRINYNSSIIRCNAFATVHSCHYDIRATIGDCNICLGRVLLVREIIWPGPVISSVGNIGSKKIHGSTGANRAVGGSDR